MGKKERKNSRNKERKGNPKKERRRLQILCVVCGFLLAVFSLLAGGTKVLGKDESGTFVERPGYGQADRTVELEAEAEDGNREVISVPVKGRIHTQEELTAIFTEMMPAVRKTMLGENTDQTQIRTDLYFPDEMEAWPGVYLGWTNTSGGIIRADGTVDNSDLTESVDTVVKLTVSSGGGEIVTNIPVTVLPAPERKTEKPWKERLSVYLEGLDTGTQTLARLNLPAEFEGIRIGFREPADYSFLIFPALGLLAAVLLELKPREEAKKKKKERETELLVDYSEIVSKLIVYIGAGLTVRNAFRQLADSYKAGNGPVRAVYEEILTADRELENGETESRVYRNFASRCGLKCYLRMASLLEQNRKTGDSSLLTSLELEMEEAFEQRKNVARRLGEEAGTKLMAPLIISLMTVLVIVVIPAFLTMG